MSGSLSLRGQVYSANLAQGENDKVKHPMTVFPPVNPGNTSLVVMG